MIGRTNTNSKLMKIAKKIGAIICCTVLATCFFIQNASSQEVISLQQAVEKTLNNNLQIKQSQLDESLAVENLSQSKYALYPTLNGNASAGKSFGQYRNQTTLEVTNQNSTSINGGLDAGVDLFRGFQKINQIRQNRILLDVNKTATEKVKNDLVLQVITQYLQVLYNKDFLRAAQDQLIVSNQLLKREQALLDAGSKTLADISLAKSQAATSELNVTNANNALTISYITLAQLMDIPSSARYEVQAPSLDKFKKMQDSIDAEGLYQKALGEFPDIKLASLNTAAAAKGIDIAKGNYYPSISLGAGVQTLYSDPSRFGGTFSEQLNDNLGQNVGLRLQIPIFNGFAARSSVRKAKINYVQSQTQEQLAKNNLNKVIYQAVADLKGADSRYSSTLNAFNAQKDAFYAVEQRYNVGLDNSLDFNTAQTNRNKAEIDFIQAKYDLLFREKVIDYYLGKPITF
ncbi:outer membrane protein [Pedobacter sp. UYP30]|uniref:TolC family protein n=1 Tax=Pedobacter sp. UYP30 TaxID=1756400 RepID=UPI0033921EDA